MPVPPVAAPAAPARHPRQPQTHVVVFRALNDNREINHGVSLMVPETSHEDATLALRLADAMEARVTIVCDTAEQAIMAAEKAATALPRHQRITYEQATQGLPRPN